MEFKVKFNSINGFPFEIGSHQQGLQDLDYIRTVIGSNITLDNVASVVSGYTQYPEIYLTEEQARKSGLFLKKNSVSVTVPKQYISNNPEMLKKYVCKDKWGRYEINIVPNREKLFEHWESLGFPTEITE